MKQLRLCGTAFEIGRQHGESFTERIGREAEDFWNESGGGRLSDAIDAAVGYLERGFPQILDEIEGIARGAKVAFERVFLFNNRSIVSAGRNSCSHLAIIRDGKSAVGFNKDSRSDASAFFPAAVVPDGGYAWVGYKHVGRVWGYGINETGLCAAGTSANPVSRQNTAASLGLYFLGPVALGRCSSTQEAVSLALNIGEVSETGNVLFADEREAAVVEFGGPQRIVRRPHAGVIASTNFFASGKIPHGDDAPYLEETRARYDNILALAAAQPTVSAEGIRGILAHHREPGSICRHSESGDRTVLSFAALPSERRLLISFGFPCSSESIELWAGR